MNIDKWWKAHGGAVIAFAGAAGALVTSVAPGIEAQISPYLGDASVVVGIVGAVLHAYQRTTPDD